MGSEELMEALRRLARRARRRTQVSPTVSVAPGCTFGAVVEARLQHLEKGLEEVKARLTALLLVAAGAVITEIVRRIF
ncbi:MAG: hypothetical protein HY676_05580 [Chloroflexi bacterium]|nr:hypothetical protein [Chloroflexota bacterium]